MQQCRLADVGVGIFHRQCRLPPEHVDPALIGLPGRFQPAAHCRGAVGLAGAAHWATRCRLQKVSASASLYQSSRPSKEGSCSRRAWTDYRPGSPVERAISEASARVGPDRWVELEPWRQSAAIHQQLCRIESGCMRTGGKTDIFFPPCRATEAFLPKSNAGAGLHTSAGGARWQLHYLRGLGGATVDRVREQVAPERHSLRLLGPPACALIDAQHATARC